MKRICAILGAWALIGPAFAEPGPALDWDGVAAGRLPGAAELEARAELAELRRELAESGPLLAERPSFTGWLGARRLEDEGSAADAELEGEWPLLADRSQRRLFAEALLRHAETLAAAARAEGRLDLRRAYAAARTAERRLALRQEEEALLRRWQERLRQVEAAGGLAAYELDLIGLEADGVAAARWAAEAELAAAWAALRALAAVPDAPAPLADPPPLAALPAATQVETLAERALAARYELAAASSRLDRSRRASRVSLLGGAAKEGEESVLRFGLAYRPFLAGEMAAADAAESGSLAALARRLEIERAALQGRLAAARQLLLAEAASPAARHEEAAARVVAAIELRLVEGKTSPAEALAARRQVFALREQLLERGLRRWHQESEILHLTEKESP